MAFDLTLDAIVIGEVALGENDKILTILTSKKGKMTVIAKGIKNINSKRGAGANLFCYSTYGFVKRNDRLWLDSIEVKDSFTGLRDDIGSVALASYFAEVAKEVCMEENDESEMLRLVLNSVYALANKKEVPAWKVKAAFELQAMCILGFSPNFDTCAACGEKLPGPEKRTVFELEQGGFVCEKCAAREDFEISKDGYAVSPETFNAVRCICTLPQNKMLSYKIPDKYVREFCTICEQYLIVHTEKNFKTLSYYKTIAAKGQV